MVMKLGRKAAGAAAATVALLATGAPTAHADGPQVAWTGLNIHVAPDGSAAYINGKYKCDGGQEGTHLWVSVKQGGDDLTFDNTSTETADVHAWYDTNWNFGQSEAGLTVDCDGHWHVTRYELQQEFGELVDGPALVQFCLFDSSGSEETGFMFDYSWKTVRVP
jgi:hypothetical protein